MSKTGQKSNKKLKSTFSRKKLKNKLKMEFILFAWGFILGPKIDQNRWKYHPKKHAKNRQLQKLILGTIFWDF